MNLSISKNIQNMDISIWEKIFAVNYYDGKEHLFPQGSQLERIKKIHEDITSYLQTLYDMGKEKFVINPYSPDVIREYENRIIVLLQRGEKADYLIENKVDVLKELSIKYSEQSYAEYKHIVDLMKYKEYESAFKCMMLRETLTKTYRLDVENEEKVHKLRKIIKDRKLDESVSGHMILNDITLDFMYKHIEHIKQYKNFAILYYAALDVFKEIISKESNIRFDKVDTYGKGRWIRFTGKTTNAEEYIKNAERLSALVQYTLWCTRTLASIQLSEGDFYVFVDNDDKPHIAVKMHGDEIDEVRGIVGGSAQELEEEYRDVAISFLEKNKEIKNGKKWLEKEELNKRLITYIRKIDLDEFKVEDMYEFIEDYFKDDYKLYGSENTNKLVLRKRLWKLQKIFAEYYGCEENEVYFGDINIEEMDDAVIPYVVIIGNIECRNIREINLVHLQRIFGKAEFSDIDRIDLQNLQTMYGKIGFNNIKKVDLRNLQTVTDDISFATVEEVNMEKLQNIGGCASFTDMGDLELNTLENVSESVYINGLRSAVFKKLYSIGESADFYSIQKVDLKNLKKVGQTIGFNEVKNISLKSLQSVSNIYFFEAESVDLSSLEEAESVDFSSIQKVNLESLRKIYGNMDFIKIGNINFKNLQFIGGDAYFSGCELVDLSNLEEVESVDFNSIQKVNLENLRKIYGDMYFDDVKSINLRNLQSIGGNAYFLKVELIDLSDLECVEGDILLNEPLGEEVKKEIETFKMRELRRTSVIEQDEER